MSRADEPERPPLAHVVGRLVEASRELVECQTVAHGRPRYSFPPTPDARLVSTWPIGSGRFTRCAAQPLIAPGAGTCAGRLDLGREVGSATEVLLDLARFATRRASHRRAARRRDAADILY